MIYLTVDIIVFEFSSDYRKVLLIQRDRPPFEGVWALPGGFVDINETLEHAAHRELEEETRLKNISLKQFHAFSEINRDPRHRTVSVVFYGFVDEKNNKVIAGSDARSAQWFLLDNLPSLAFDHGKILQKLIKTQT
jgi:8-oxo-dGTP diphosphatase